MPSAPRQVQRRRVRRRRPEGAHLGPSQQHGLRQGQGIVNHHAVGHEHEPAPRQRVQRPERDGRHREPHGEGRGAGDPLPCRQGVADRPRPGGRRPRPRPAARRAGGRGPGAASAARRRTTSRRRKPRPCPARRRRAPPPERPPAQPPRRPTHRQPGWRPLRPRPPPASRNGARSGSRSWAPASLPAPQPSRATVRCWRPPGRAGWHRPARRPAQGPGAPGGRARRHPPARRRGIPRAGRFADGGAGWLFQAVGVAEWGRGDQERATAAEELQRGTA